MPQIVRNEFGAVWGNGGNPGTSALNPAAGEPPTPNAVSTDLTQAGVFNVYNDAGSVHVIIDVSGYFTKSSLQMLAASQPFVVTGFDQGETAGSNWTEIVDVAVTGPVAGHVTVTGDGQITESTDGDEVECGISDSASAPARSLIWQSPEGGDVTTFSVTEVFPITAGGAATYSMMCRNRNGETTGINVPMVTAIFTPAP